MEGEQLRGYDGISHTRAYTCVRECGLWKGCTCRVRFHSLLTLANKSHPRDDNNENSVEQCTVCTNLGQRRANTMKTPTSRRTAKRRQPTSGPRSARGSVSPAPRHACTDQNRPRKKELLCWEMPARRRTTIMSFGSHRRCLKTGPGCPL